MKNRVYATPAVKGLNTHFMWFNLLMKQIKHDCYTAVQRQKVVSAYFTSKQVVPFGFAEQCNRA